MEQAHGDEDREPVGVGVFACRVAREVVLRAGEGFLGWEGTPAICSAVSMMKRRS